MKATLDMNRIRFTSEGELRLPCGKCSECVKKRASDWAIRARHEMSLHSENCFLTLTYDDAHLPSIDKIKDEFQLFMKRLREYLKKPLRYMVSHEYGSKTFRPHHHILIFGYDPAHQSKLRITEKGSVLYSSPEIAKLWTAGYHSIGAANEKCAFYIASYALKGSKHSLVDPKSGEMISVSDSMDVSKRPAIGSEYFRANYQQMIDSKMPLPRYYVKLLQKINPTLHQRFEDDRTFIFQNRSSHELYAKSVIDNQKNSESEFRSFEDDIDKQNKYIEDSLRFNRDEYHRINKKDYV